MKLAYFLHTAALVVAALTVLARATVQGEARQSGAPLGPPGTQATYRLELDARVQSNVVERLTVSLGPVEDHRGMRCQWLALQARKFNGQRFAAWILGRSFPPRTLGEALTNTVRYLFQEGEGPVREFSHRLTNAAVLPTLGAWEYLWPRPEPNENGEGIAAQRLLWLGHRYVRRRTSRPLPSAGGDYGPDRTLGCHLEGIRSRKVIPGTGPIVTHHQPLLAMGLHSCNLRFDSIPMFQSVPQREACGSRRHFLHVAGALAIGATSGRSLFAAVGSEAPATTPQDSALGKPDRKQVIEMRIGILLGTFARPTLEARLDAVKACGLDCVQVSLDCAGLPAMPDEISLELAGRIRREAGARRIGIAAMQGTFNMSHPDAEQRRTGLRRLRVLAEACSQLGTSIIHLCTGTRDPENMWRRNPDNDSAAAWRDMATCVRAATEIARQAGVVLAFEPEVNNVVDSAQEARRLLDEIGSPHLRVTIDPANIFHAGELPRMQEILDTTFALLGKDIVLAHAKDLDHDGDAGHKAAGQGKLDYDRYLSLLHTHGFKGPLLLHGLSEAQVPGCVAFLRDKLARLAK